MLTFAAPQDSFIANTPEENAQTLADYVLSDKLHAAKNIKDSNFRKTLEAFSQEFTRAEAKLEELVDEYYPAITNNLIVEWERALSIPDECFKVKKTATIEFRRKQVISKLALMNATTQQDFVDLAAFFDVDVEITSGKSPGNVFPYVFPLILFLNDKAAFFTMIVNFLNLPPPENVFNMTFPFIFDQETLATMILCLFNKMKPAPVEIIPIFSGS